MEAFIKQNQQHPHIKQITQLSQQFNLTDREAELVGYLLADKSLAEVAQWMGISKETARFHIKNVFKKTGTHSQPQLILLALRP